MEVGMEDEWKRGWEGNRRDQVWGGQRERKLGLMVLMGHLLDDVET